HLSAGGVTPDVITKSGGQFTLTGLLARSYVLMAYDPLSFNVIYSPPIQSGSEDVVLVLADDAMAPVLEGHVVSIGGRPINGAGVGLMLPTEGDPTTETDAAFLFGTRVLTDETGHFKLERVCRHGVHLNVSSDQIIPRRVLLDQSSDWSDLKIEVEE